MRKSLFLIGAVVAALLSTVLVEAAGPRERALSIVRSRVSPYAVRVDSGTTVTWRNLDTVAHTVSLEKHIATGGTETALSVVSPSLARYDRASRQPAAAFSHTFVDAGTYRYRLDGKGTALTITVNAAKPQPTQTAGTPTATATPRPPTATPTATPKPVLPAAIATVAPWPPAQPPADAERGYCGGWEAVRDGTTVRLTGECMLRVGQKVTLTPRVASGAALLVDRLVTGTVAANAGEPVVVPVDLVLAAGTDRKSVVVMPDRVGVPIADAPVETPTP